MAQAEIRSGRYLRKIQHIHHQKKYFLAWQRGSYAKNMSYEEYLATLSEQDRTYRSGPNMIPNSSRYWENYSETFRKQNQNRKKFTNRAIRNQWKQIKNNIGYDFDGDEDKPYSFPNNDYKTICAY